MNDQYDFKIMYTFIPLIFNLILLSLLSASVFAQGPISKAQSLSTEVLNNHSQKGLLLLGVLELENVSIQDHRLSEFSGLVWDRDENLLIAVSDQGFLLHLRPAFEHGHLVKVEPITIHPLLDENNQPLTGLDADSEGLVNINHNNGITGDSELYVSFERRPRISHYRLDGTYIKNIQITTVLQDAGFYKNNNRMLEALAYHQDYGLITAPEQPADKDNETKLTVYSMSDQLWSFIPSSPAHGSIVGLTNTSDGQLIALERIYSNIFLGARFALHYVKLLDDGIEHERLFDIGPVDGYFNDNFEGIAHHQDDYFFMISDDNNSALQRTLLVYFEIKRSKTMR